LHGTRDLGGRPKAGARELVAGEAGETVIGKVEPVSRRAVSLLHATRTTTIVGENDTGCFGGRSKGDVTMRYEQTHAKAAFLALLSFLLVSPYREAHAQPAWRPAKHVELITSSAAGGSNDQIARVVQRIMQEGKLAATPVMVINKPGGNQTIAPTYLNQNAGDPHYLLLANPTLFANHLSARTPINYTDLTPVALLLSEHTVFTVRSDSPIKNMRDALERLKADPDAISIGIVSRGGPNHLALAQSAKTAGIEPRRLKTVVFKTNAESMTAMVGGHLQLVASSLSSASGQVRAGNARILGIASPQRMAGAYADVPTLAEQGIEAKVSSWRGVFGPKGMTDAQIAYWENALAKMAASEEWKKSLEAQSWDGRFLGSRDFTKYLAAEYEVTRAIMTELGLAK
jgi:putative tricarboxylic transport membrane protein